MKSKAKKRNGKKEGVAEPPFELVTSNSNRNYAHAFTAVAKLLEGRKNVLVLAGAGQSVSCGIPDFRSRGSGLYSNLDTQELGLTHPEDLFDYEVFCEDPAPFYKFAKNLYFPTGDKRVEPSDSHRFLALLQKKGMLLRVYTQNIDGLEQVAGVSPKKIVYSHGSLQWATCLKCKTRVSAADIEQSILEGTVPRCQQLAAKVNTPPKASRPESARIRKRARPEPLSKQTHCGGVLKPGVTFFGESLHGNVKRSLEADREKADALIVIGTSLSVAPMSHVIDYLRPNIPRILINRNIVRPPMSNFEEDSDSDDDEDFRKDYVFDALLLGFCDDVTRALVKEMTGTPNDEKGKLLSCLEDDDELYDIGEWDSLTLPKDRVFLFPGASRGDDISEYSYREIAHCDGCAKQITGTVRKCVQCFDYDLCEACYPMLSKKHHKGQHTFSSEPAAISRSTETP
jgi:NAD-dependent SIR2 family protein deacetylase